MSDLLTLAAQIARGEYHPSDCAEDYRKGTGRVEFAKMARDKADWLRAKIRILQDAHARIAALEKERDAYKLRTQALEALCASYRLQRPPSQKTWKLLEKSKAAVKALAGGEAE